MNRRSILWFLAASAVLGAAIFRGALWGERLLAPLDLAPTLCSKYRWMAPDNSGIPANHYTIDQLTYDLPLQRTIHSAYRRGEMPWWDPYTYCGRPLLADAHINGTDPIRLLCNACLPFELAYNWTLILHWVLTGLGVTCLLGRWRIHPAITVGLALAAQCAGYQAIMFGHPWNVGSFLFYPWLWLAWEAWLAERRWWAWPVGILATAGVFYAGNPQSHSYLALFALAFLAAYGGRSLAGWRRTFPIVAVCGVLGAALAAPVLAGQLEFLHLSVRSAPIPLRPLGWLSGLASLSGVYPWVLGTFRTLDLSKFLDQYETLDQYALGFVVFIGSAGVGLAALGAWRGRAMATPRERHRLGCLLVLAYLVIQSTPLQAALYTRSAGLAVLGLVVLAALGLEDLRQHDKPLRGWAFGFGAIAVAVTLALNVVAFAIYPRLLPRIRDIVQRRAMVEGTSLDLAPALRKFQVENLPREISVQNPETLFATASLLALAGLCWRPAWCRKRWVLPVVLGLNLAPAAMFYARFIPNQPVAGWRRLQQGGPEQQKVASLFSNRVERLHDVASGFYDRLLPSSLGHLHGVRTVHGYSALVPRCLFALPAAEQIQWQSILADATYTSDQRGLDAGVLTSNSLAQSPVSFQWRGPEPRSLSAELVSLNVQQVTLEPGPAGTLLWTDTAYPGWRAEIDSLPAVIRSVPPCFSEIAVPAGGRMVLRLHYQPTWLGLGLALASGAVAGSLLLTGWAAREAKQARVRDRERIHRLPG